MRNQVALKMCLALLGISFVESYSLLPDKSFLNHPVLDVQKLKRSAKVKDTNQKGCIKKEMEKFEMDYSKCVEKITTEHIQKMVKQSPNVTAMKATMCQMLTKAVECVAKTSPKCVTKAEREETEKEVLEQLVELAKNRPMFGEEFISGCPILEKYADERKSNCKDDDHEKLPACVEKLIMEHYEKILTQVPDVDAMKATACQMLTKSVGCVAEERKKCNVKGMEDVKDVEDRVFETIVEVVENEPMFGKGFLSNCPILKERA